MCTISEKDRPQKPWNVNIVNIHSFFSSTINNDDDGRNRSIVDLQAKQCSCTCNRVQKETHGTGKWTNEIDATHSRNFSSRGSTKLYVLISSKRYLDSSIYTKLCYHLVHSHLNFRGFPFPILLVGDARCEICFSSPSVQIMNTRQNYRTETTKLIIYDDPTNKRVLNGFVRGAANTSFTRKWHSHHSSRQSRYVRLRWISLFWMELMSRLQILFNFYFFP